MAGPWEKYQTAAPAAQAGPWMKYQTASPAAPAPTVAPPAPPAAPNLGDDFHAFQTGAMQGMTFGLDDELNAGLMTPIQAGVDAFKGLPFDLGRAYNEALAGNRGLDQQGEAANPTLATAGQVAGGLVTGGALAKGGVTLMNGAKPVLASIVPRAAAEGSLYGAAQGFGQGDDLQSRLQGAETGGALGAALGGGTGAIARAMIGAPTTAAAVPTVDQLEAQAGALYDAARNNGTVIPQQTVADTANDIASRAISDGIDPTLHPRATAALNRVQAASGKPMTVADAMTMRRVLGGAATDNANPDEQRIAGAMIRRFDQMTSNADPTLAQANQLYASAKRGATIEQAIELAASRAGQFSGSGFENALRTEFRGLQRQIIKGQMKGLSPDEVDAINKVANGGPVENALRFVGKLAPTGIVSLGVDTGIPFTIGNAVAGPAAGAAASGATMGAGMIARALATRMTAANANMASTIARNGGRALTAAGSIPAAYRSIVDAMISAEGSQAPRVPGAVANAMTSTPLAIGN